MKELRLARKIIRTLVKDEMYYPGRLIFGIVPLIARCGVLLVLYAYVFRLNGGSISGVDFVTAAWSMLFYFITAILGVRALSKAIEQDVQSGDVEVLFSKPVSYVLYRVWWQIGKRLFSFVTLSTLAMLTLGFVVGVPATMHSWFFVATALVTLVTSFVLEILVYTLLGLAAFWMEDVRPLFWVVDKTVMVLGGSYLPVALFPAILYKVAIYSPFGLSLLITHTVYDSWRTEWVHLLTLQALWIVGLSIAVMLVFARARKNVFVNGG